MFFFRYVFIALCTSVRLLVIFYSEQLFETADGLKYWKSSESTDIKTKDIEGTAYALLTYIEVGETAEARPIFDWLVSQRKSGGGFSSTQVWAFCDL